MIPIYDNECPSGWEEDELCNVTVRKRGYSWSKDDETKDPDETTVPVLRIPNIQERLDLDNLLHLRNVSAEAMYESAITKDWILFVGSNGNPARIGDSALMTEDKRMIFASFLMGISSKEPRRISPRFLAAWLRLHRVHEAFSRTSQQTTGLANFSWSAVKRLPVRFPTRIEEQDLIAKLLDVSDELIQATSEKLNSARRLKTALMRQLFTRGLPGCHTRFVETKLGEIPADWDVIELKNCGTWNTGGTPDRDNPAFWNGLIPWVKSGEIDYREISDTEEKLTEAGAASINGELLTAGTLVVAMYGAGVTRGKVAILGLPAYVNQAIACFNGNEDTINEWLFYWFERNYERVRALAGGSNQDNLSLYLLKNVKIARPQRKEQELMVSILKMASEVIFSITDEILTLRKLKRSLLQNLLTGRLRLATEPMNDDRRNSSK